MSKFKTVRELGAIILFWGTLLSLVLFVYHLVDSKSKEIITTKVESKK